MNAHDMHPATLALDLTELNRVQLILQRMMTLQSAESDNCFGELRRYPASIDYLSWIDITAVVDGTRWQTWNDINGQVSLPPEPSHVNSLSFLLSSLG